MENKRTCLYDKHVALGALMQPFGGFDMPIQYTSIIDEHQAVREHCGVFDVSHMGEVYVTGNDAERYVNHIFTNDVTHAPIGQVFYGMMLYPDGGTSMICSSIRWEKMSFSSSSMQPISTKMWLGCVSMQRDSM